MKKILSVIVIASFLFSIILPQSLSASEIDPNESKVITVDGLDVYVPDFVSEEDITNINQLDSLSDSASFDLSTQETQTVLVPLENGEVGSMTIEPITNLYSRATYTLTGNQKWRIYWSSGVINMSYYINTSVSNNKGSINSYYDESYLVVGMNVISESFTKSGNTVTYKLGLQNPILSTSSTLKASVSGKTLTTKWY